MNTLTSRRNPICVHLKKLGVDSNYRKISEEFLCDGIRLLEEAVKYNAEIPIILTSIDNFMSLDFINIGSSEVYYVDSELLNSLSPLKQSQKVLFTCKTQKTESLSDFSGVHVLLDNIQDPGNVGTIIRTANAFGIKTVMLFGNCVDPYNLKTVRGTMGSIFSQRIHSVSLQDLTVYKNNGMRFFGAAISNDCRDFSEMSYKNSVIAIGNEGSGLSPEVLLLCDEKIKIPMKESTQSLNAAIAAGIIMQKAGQHVET